MLVFPSLQSQAIVQLPSRYETTARLAEVHTISNKSYFYLDSASCHRVWRLAFHYLTDLERAALDDFFQQVGGRLRTFTFLSPFENLLGDSTMNSSRWVVDPSLTLQFGTQAPSGDTSAVLVSNPSGMAAEFKQVLTAPAWFRYTLSVYARSAATSTLQLFVRSNSTEASEVAQAAIYWTREQLTVSSLSEGETLEAGVRIPPLTEVYLYGPQLEVAATATNYKQTEARSGIYTECRFLNDTLTWRSDAVDSHSTQIEIISRM